MLANVIVVLISKSIGSDKLLSDLGESAAIPLVDATAKSSSDKPKVTSIVSPEKMDGVVNSIAHIDLFNIFIF
jgi:hypothetical protein